MTRREWFGSVLVILAGCANLAVHPPTPARDLPTAGLDDPEPGCRYFLVVFGSQITPRIPGRVHNFATVVKTCSPGPGEVGAVVEHRTISWLPETLKIRVFAMHPEPGKNFPLHETIAWALADGQRVSRWGPYEIGPGLYRRFVVQKQFLDSGAIGYQCLDVLGEAGHKGNGAHCIHALTDMDPEFGRAHYPLWRYGEDASRWIVRVLGDRGLLLDREKTYPELNATLGLCDFPIIQRPDPG
jgi:hypothetical protein